MDYVRIKVRYYQNNNHNLHVYSNLLSKQDHEGLTAYYKIARLGWNRSFLQFGLSLHQAPWLKKIVHHGQYVAGNSNHLKAFHVAKTALCNREKNASILSDVISNLRRSLSSSTLHSHSTTFCCILVVNTTVHSHNT